MKIIIDSAIPYIKNRIPPFVETVYMPGKEIDEEIVKDADALIVRTRTRCAEDLLRNSKVKLVSTATIGTDHIDIPWCEKNGIKVVSAPGCNAPGVAQYVLASLYKSGFNPKKDTLGIIGFGHVGQIVADWAATLGIKTIISDDPRKEAGYKDVEYQSMDYLLRESDAVTLHVPLVKDGKFHTINLIGEKELDLMKSGAVLVNSSRGGVVDEAALKKELKEGRVKAVIDVWENEPEIDRELVDLSFISTPHIAGYSAEGKKRATRMVLESVKDFFDIPVDLTGLECVPASGEIISGKMISDSYDPMKDSEDLKRDTTKFEELRNRYNYRHEPLFLQDNLKQ